MGHIAVSITIHSHSKSSFRVACFSSLSCLFPALRFLALFSSLTFLLTLSTHAAPAFRTFLQEDGLAADYINSVAFAPDSVWFATPRGATNVQDKYWVTYTAAHGLGATAVSDIAVAGDGKIYFATNGGGLTVFDNGARKTYNVSNSAIPSNYLTSVSVDKQDRVWMGTFGAGVARLAGDTWTKYSLGDNYVNALELDASGNPWVVTNSGAFFFDGKTWTALTRATGLPSSRVYSLAIAPDGRIWFGTDSGATVYDGRRYRTYRESDGLASNFVQAIAADTANRVWFGTSSGLSLLNDGQWKTYTRADGLADDRITSLGVDANGNLWVGTTRGLSTLGDTGLKPATSLPVVLVHGWHGPDSDRFEDSEFRFLKNYMERDGIQPFYADGILPTRTLFQNAARLRDVIANVKAQTGAPRVDIIAFSMGGLNTRAYLESTLYQNDVRRAIILGTPQAGVRMWYPLLTREIEDRPSEPSPIELTPEYADLFNRTHSPRPTVPYDLLVGDARNQQGLDLLKILPPSDGLISVSSAHALTGPHVRQITDTDVHAWNPTPVPFNITSYLYPQQTYDRYLRNSLRDPDVRPIGFSAARVSPLAPRNITPMNVDMLRAGETITRTVDIDAARAVRFFARWTAGDISLGLRAPDGTRYTADDFHQATYLKADIGSFVGYALPRAQAGTWSMTITRNDKGTTPDTVTAYADLDSDLRLDASTDRAWYNVGASVVVSATLSNRLAGADVRAGIEWLGDGVTPRGASTEIKLLEEGRPGTYAETLTGLTRGGYYLLRITARAPRVARERQVIFAVSPDTARFAGAARARVEGSPGSYTGLVIEAPVNVKRAGAFALGATLRDADGRLVTSLSAPLTLNAGAQTASVTVPGRDLRALGIAGPYTVDLTLMDASWAAIQVDEISKAVTTDAFRANDFGE